MLSGKDVQSIDFHGRAHLVLSGEPVGPGHACLRLGLDNELVSFSEVSAAEMSDGCARVPGGSMHVDELLGRLGYTDSPHFLEGDALAYAGEHGHAFRKAKDACGLRGVYTLKPAGAGAADGGVVPLVYVCEAPTIEDARAIHRRVWNQNIVPFLIVRTPRDIRLYAGFRYQLHADDGPAGILRSAVRFNQAMEALHGLEARDIDEGTVWQTWGQEVTPDTRVDWRLLDNLERLGAWLRHEGLDTHEANSLIGKYVYLRYLRDRQILSERRMRDWNLDPAKIFGRHATLKAFYQLTEQLHEWLNGSVFPLPNSLQRRLTRDQLRYVAGAFQGDAPDGQMHLDFHAYDFSFIPIETLSAIYEQFLHAQDAGAGKSRASEQYVYYTPIPLVDFMLDQMDACKPLQPGMRVLDPACGSGAFLVQCYRRLVERTLRSRPGKHLRPTELRELLMDSIFGVDIDSDACHVAELSLILTLLDYIDPPDLSRTSFKLPALRNRNVFHGDAFEEDGAWVRAGQDKGYDWVVGNPPWGEFKGISPQATHPHLAAWLRSRSKSAPVGDHQIAEAFAWRACEVAAAGGLVGFLIPAMSLFRSTPAFRESLFRRVVLHRVVNFANLTEVLFAGRSRLASAALFYSVPQNTDISRPRSVLSYAPFRANQEAGSSSGNKRIATWSIVIDSSELREIPYREIVDGDSRPWKLAMWGSALDQRLLRSVERRYQSLGDLAAAGRIRISEGLQLRARGTTGEALEHHPELAGRPRLLMPPLKRLRNMFAFPAEALEHLAADHTYVRAGRYELPASVCEPPHIIVSAARTFAVFTNRFLIVPARQVGISAGPAETSFLKALSLYLSSDFALYHQFLSSTQIGIKRPVATLGTLRALPVAIAAATKHELATWVDLHGRLVDATHAAFAAAAEDRPPLSAPPMEMAGLLAELNELVYESLQLDRRARALVHDLVQVKMSLDDGRIGEAAVRMPTRAEVLAYAEMLRAELDGFVDDDDVAHRVTVMMGEHAGGMVQVALVWADEVDPAIEVLDADDRAAREFRALRAHLIERRSQWVYFERNLRIYEGEIVYLFKPMRRLHWTESQAIIDAGEIIADTISGEHE